MEKEKAEGKNGGEDAGQNSGPAKKLMDNFFFWAGTGVLGALVSAALVGEVDKNAAMTIIYYSAEAIKYALAPAALAVFALYTLENHRLKVLKR